MSRQLTFDLPVRPALGRADFFVSRANALAVRMLENWRDWPAGKLVLVGPAGAGKTHLAHVWAADCGARVVAAADLGNIDIAPLAQTHVAVEDVDRMNADPQAEAALFHLHNLVLANRRALLLTGAVPPARWRLCLPDLASRMQGTPTTTIAPPDDALLAAVLVKLFGDRQLVVAPAVIAYLVPRMERSFDAAQSLVARLDRAALSEGRAITQPLAARLLDKPAAPTA